LDKLFVEKDQDKVDGKIEENANSALQEESARVKMILEYLNQ